MRNGRVGCVTTAVAIGVLAAALGAGPAPQDPGRADADDLRSAYDTLRDMAKTSPYAAIPWQYLGPANISGRATDIAVAERGTGRRIYAGYATSGVWQSDDNGGSWTPIFDDYTSTNAGTAWAHAVSAGGAQVYNVTLDTSAPAWAYGSMQDIGSRRGRVDLSAGRDRLPALDWVSAPGGEGSHHAIDPANPNIVYSHGFYGNFTRDDVRLAPPGNSKAARGGGSRESREGSLRSTRIRPKDIDLRAQWMAPIVTSLHTPGTVYAAYQYVFRSPDRGETWEKMSGDLTDNDPAKMLPRSPAEIPYQTIVALAESPTRQGLLYAGTDDGRLHVTMDDGKRWSELTAGLRRRTWISRVVPSRHAEATVYVTQRGREDDDFAPYIDKSSDYGSTFTSIVNNLPAGCVNVIREDPTDANILYAGTDLGAFVSVDGGRRWEVLGSNLPSVQVSDLQYHARDKVIVISTYGRGMWALDAARLHGSPRPDYQAFYSKGVTFAEFLERARARRDEWRRRYSDAVVTPDLVTRMRALPERRRLLVVAEDWCSDSAHTIPYVARLVDGAPERLALRVIGSTAGRSVMEANRTPDGRAATPTIVVLREDGGILGSWVERPSTAQAWFLEQQKTLVQPPLHEQLMKWYAEDAGRTTMAEIADLLER